MNGNGVRLFLALCIVGLALGCEPQQSQAPQTPAPPETQATKPSPGPDPGPASQPVPLKDWEFPGAASHRSSTGEGWVVGDYATTEPFQKVWEFYAKKFGSKQDYAPNLTSSESGGEFQVAILDSADQLDPSQARPHVKSATLLRRGPQETVTVFISRGQEEDQTYFTLVVESR